MWRGDSFERSQKLSCGRKRKGAPALWKLPFSLYEPPLFHLLYYSLHDISHNQAFRVWSLKMQVLHRPSDKVPQPGEEGELRLLLLLPEVQETSE